MHQCVTAVVVFTLNEHTITIGDFGNNGRILWFWVFEIFLLQKSATTNATPVPVLVPALTIFIIIIFDKPVRLCYVACSLITLHTIPASIFSQYPLSLSLSLACSLFLNSTSCGKNKSRSIYYL